jgi:hypothetical protein
MPRSAMVWLGLAGLVGVIGLIANLAPSVTDAAGGVARSYWKQAVPLGFVLVAIVAVAWDAMRSHREEKPGAPKRPQSREQEELQRIGDRMFAETMKRRVEWSRTDRQ